jgi:DNA gyrase subunit A
MAETITPVSLRVETEERYFNYAMSVILSRALPDVRDGLKPVQRRILYTMYHELHLTFDNRPRKCAKIVGDVTGNYHPHGGTAVYEALVRLAQNWVLRVPLVLGQGNFGSPDGDKPAADRYTEARLTQAAGNLMSELGQRTVEMRPNYDNTRQEPVVLPAQFPNLLVNGSSGIAVGLATNVPPHNLGEVIRACVLLIDHPEATTAQLMEKVKGPDFPLGGRVVSDRATLRRIYEEGQGSIKVQAEWKEEEVGRRKQIVVTSLPYAVEGGKLESDIGEIIASRKLPQLIGLANESNEREGIRLVLEIKPNTDPEVVMAYLYKHTALQNTFSYNLTCLVPAQAADEKERLEPARLGLKAILRHFLDFRFVTVRRRFEYELEQLERRIHILEGFRIIFAALDEAIRLIRESKGKADAQEKLIQRFSLDEVQASAVLDAQLYKIAQMEIKKILDELKDKKARAQAIRNILASDKKLWGVVKEELTALLELPYGKERRHTRMGSAEDTPDFDPEAYIVRENANVVLTREGWIKRVGRLSSVESTRVREGDEVRLVLPGNTHDYLIFFAEDGSAYTMRISEVPATTGYGEPIVKFFRLGDQIRIVDALTTDERFTPADQPSPSNGIPAGPYLLVVTLHGQVVRTPLTPFRTASTKVGRRFVRLAEGDRVVLATLLTNEKSLMLASSSGHVIHFPVEEINILSGAGKGVMGMRLDKNASCLGGVLVRKGSDVLTVETTAGKVMEFRASRYDPTSRGGKGYPAIKRGGFTRVIPPPIQLVDWDQLEEKEQGKGPNPHHNGVAQKSLFGGEP